VADNRVVVHDTAELAGLTGRDLGPSPWVEITQEPVDAFAEVVDDRHWVHTDPRAAAAGPFGVTIAHAHLTLSLIVSMFGQVLLLDDGGSTMFYGYDRVRFPTAVPVGSRIRLRARLEEVAEIGDAVQLRTAFVVEVDSGPRPACVAEAVWRHYPVPAPA
jgi:acyl dehydratase